MFGASAAELRGAPHSFVCSPGVAGAGSSGRMRDSPFLGWDWAGELDLLVKETLTLPT